ncbi:L-threonylcarbamoyladenylate synthase [Candidatus Neomarinimicrobiota bacterium]
MEVIASTNKLAAERFWDVIHAGGIVAYPTDTLYGFGVDSTNREAVDRLITLKGRRGPFSVMVGSLELMTKYALISQPLHDKLSQQLPGPFTFILSVPKTSPITANVRDIKNKVGFRVPDHPFVRSAYKMNDLPVVTTSVNKAGQLPQQDPAAISVDFNGEIDLLIDDGALPPSVGSTVVDGTLEIWQIVRQGAGVL